MGIARTTVECGLPEIEEFRRMIRRFNKKAGNEEEIDRTIEERTVCVTSGISFLGLWIVKELLDSGYSVRLALENQEDLEKLRELEAIRGRNRVFAVIAKITELASLIEAFDGCNGVFHTSSFMDPAGISGYSKHMAKLESKAAETVIEACSRTPSVRKCVFTSSLLACIWRDSGSHNLQPTLDENCWSEENLCREKKLWFALGKTVSEKAAWNKATERNVKLVTICPALVTGPGFSHRNSTGSIAYLKGAREMYTQGLLATVDVKKLAEAHMHVYEAMDKGACGRYICFDNVIDEGEEAAELARRIGVPDSMLTHVERDEMARFNVSNAKLSRLLPVTPRCSDSVRM